MDRERRQWLWQQVLDYAPAGAPSQASAEAVCTVCVGVIAEVDAAAITVRTESRVQEMVASSAPWAAQLEQLQYTVGEGPGVEAFTIGGPVLVGHLDPEGRRWPAFTDAALELDVGAAFAFPLQTGAVRLGTLGLYRHATGGLSRSGLSDASVLAELALMVVLKRAHHEARYGLGEADAPEISYQDVHVATGMLAVLLQISLDDAFMRLRAHAYSCGRSVLDVSRDVVARRIGPEQMAD